MIASPIVIFSLQRLDAMELYKDTGAHLWALSSDVVRWCVCMFHKSTVTFLQRQDFSLYQVRKFSTNLIERGSPLNPIKQENCQTTFVCSTDHIKNGIRTSMLITLSYSMSHFIFLVLTSLLYILTYIPKVYSNIIQETILILLEYNYFFLGWIFHLLCQNVLHFSTYRTRHNTNGRFGGG